MWNTTLWTSYFLALTIPVPDLYKSIDLYAFLNCYVDELLNPISGKKIGVSRNLNMPFDQIIILEISRSVDEGLCTKIGLLRWYKMLLKLNKLSRPKGW